MIIYHDRRQAGQQLAKLLTDYQHQPNTLILALPRGGVPVGYEVAHALKIPFDIFLVRKLGVRGHEELAMGAIAMGDHYVFNHEIIEALEIPDAAIEQEIAKQQQLIAERNQRYRSNKQAPELKGKTIILIDDGLATGATMRVAMAAIKQEVPAQLIVAVPVGAKGTCQQLEQEADKVICAQTPEPFYSVGRWYENFDQTTDAEVVDLLKNSLRSH